MADPRRSCICVVVRAHMPCDGYWRGSRWSSGRKAGRKNCRNGIDGVSSASAVAFLRSAALSVPGPDSGHKKPPCWRPLDEDPVVLADLRYRLCDVANLLDVVHLLKRIHDGLAVACGGDGVHAGKGESALDGSEKLALVHNGPFVIPLL